jgi:hypothetical protein
MRADDWTAVDSAAGVGIQVEGVSILRLIIDCAAEFGTGNDVQTTCKLLETIVLSK